MQSSVAERLRVARARLGLSLVEAAELTGVDRHTIAAVERGKRAPYYPTIEKLAGGYGVPIDELMTPPASTFSGSPESVKVQAPPVAPDAFERTSERSLSYIDAWARFVEGFETDIDEWHYEQTNKLGVLDPADLDEDEFLPFVHSAMPFIQTYSRLSNVVYDDAGGLERLLQVEANERGEVVREIERFVAAFRRVSRTIQRVVTERVAQRVEQLAKAEQQKPAEEQTLPENVVNIFGKARRAA